MVHKQLLSLNPESYSLNIQLFNMYWMLFSKFISALSSYWISECHHFVVVGRVQDSAVSFSLLGAVALYESYYFFRDYPMLIMLPERRCDWRQSTSTWTSLEVGCGGAGTAARKGHLPETWPVSAHHFSLCIGQTLMLECTADAWDWMHMSKLKLNASKTKVVCFSPPSTYTILLLTSSIRSSSISFTNQVRDLRFTFIPNWKWRNTNSKHVKKNV